MIDYTAGIDVTYLHWKVEAYRCETFSEGIRLAQNITARKGYWVPVMEYLDAETPPYEAGGG